MRALTQRSDAVINSINVALGVILLISPWLFGFATAGAATWTAGIGGLVIAAVSFAALIQLLEWEERVNFVAGLCVMGAPWLFGFAGVASAMWTHVVLGLVVTALAVLELWRLRVGPFAGLT